MKIGIPGALLCFIYYPLWKTFLQELGHEAILSSTTNRRILDDGVKNCVDDACLPVKLFHGHVMDLMGKVDRILIPRLIRVKPGEYICPKFIGLPEMIKNSVPGKPKLLIMDFNVHRGVENGYQGMRSLGRKLGASHAAIRHALRKAMETQDAYTRLLLMGFNPNAILGKDEKLLSEIRDQQNAGKRIDEQPDKRVRGKNREACKKVTKVRGRIGLIGHPYLVYDQYVNMNICEKLDARGYDCLFPENIPSCEIERACERYPKKLFWTYGKNLLGSGLTMMEQGRVDGLILVTGFNCGIDSFIDDLLQRANQREYHVPLTTITLDEHTGQAGIDTRLEAFLDMLEWRRKYDSYFPSHGADVYYPQRTV